MMAHLRDVEGLKVYHNPAGDLNTMIVGINQPTRIRTVTVMPGDVVLGKLGVVVFIPPHLRKE